MNLLERAEAAAPPARGGTARTIAQRAGRAVLGLALVLALLAGAGAFYQACLLYTSPSPRDS